MSIINGHCLRGMVASCALTLGTPAALADGISGTYVGKGSNGAFLVQIVGTSDGHLTGRYEQVVLQTNGALADMNATIDGAVDGQTVVVTIKPAEFLSGSIAASGSIEGSVLHLTGGGNGSSLTLNLVRSDEAAFHAQVAALADQARQITDANARQEAARRQAKAAAEWLANLQDLTQRMDSFTGKVAANLLKFPPVEQQYHTITGRMRGALAKEQTIYGGGQAAVARSQIFVAINQASIDANQIHINVQVAFQEFDFKAGQLQQEAAGVAQSCHRAHVATVADPVPADSEEGNSACLRFLDVAKEFQQRVAATRKAFAHIEQVWMAERRDQEAFVRASDLATH